jgi:hypothetical protein
VYFPTQAVYMNLRLMFRLSFLPMFRLNFHLMFLPNFLLMFRKVTEIR